MDLFTLCLPCGWKLSWGMWSHKGSFSTNQYLRSYLDPSPAPSDHPPSLYLSGVYYAHTPSNSLSHTHIHPLYAPCTVIAGIFHSAAGEGCSQLCCQLHCGLKRRRLFADTLSFFFFQPTFPGHTPVHSYTPARNHNYMQWKMADWLWSPWRERQEQIHASMNMCVLSGLFSGAEECKSNCWDTGEAGWSNTSSSVSVSVSISFSLLYTQSLLSPFLYSLICLILTVSPSSVHTIVIVFKCVKGGIEDSGVHVFCID